MEFPMTRDYVLDRVLACIPARLLEWPTSPFLSVGVVLRALPALDVMAGDVVMYLGRPLTVDVARDVRGSVRQLSREEYWAFALATAGSGALDLVTFNAHTGSQWESWADEAMSEWIVVRPALQSVVAESGQDAWRQLLAGVGCVLS